MLHVRLTGSLALQTCFNWDPFEELLLLVLRRLQLTSILCPRRAPVLVSLLGLWSLLLLVVSVHGQTPEAGLSTQPKDRMQFEVVSLRVSKPGAPVSTNLDLDSSDYSRYTGGLVTASGLLINYIIFAYKIEDQSQYPAVWDQLPKWAREEQFVLQARPGGDTTKDGLRQMVKAMLAEHFKLALHTKMASRPAYALVLDKPGTLGSALKQRGDDQLCATASTAPATHGSGAEPPPRCELVLGYDHGEETFRMMDYTMAQIAGHLFEASKRELDSIPVLDRTGLPGRYDIRVHYHLPARDPSADAASAEPGESFTDALKSQAGLRLQKQVAEVEVYVVDHVEQPPEK